MSQSPSRPEGAERILIWLMYSVGTVVWAALAAYGHKITVGLVIAMLFAFGTTLQALLRALGSPLIRRRS
jgi:hypothetical protein